MPPGRFVLTEEWVDRRTHDMLSVGHFEDVLAGGVDVLVEGRSVHATFAKLAKDDWGRRWLAEFQGAWVPKWVAELRAVITSSTGDGTTSQINTLWSSALRAALVSGDPEGYIAGFENVVLTTALLAKKTRKQVTAEILEEPEKEPPSAGR